MKRLVFSLVSFVLALTSIAQVKSSDSISLKTLVKNEEAAWNKHDWKDFTSRFTDDGTLINFVGAFWKDKNDILNHFTMFADALVDTKLVFEIDRIRMLTDSIAIVYVKQVIEVTKDNDGPLHKNKKGDKEYKMISLVCLKKGSDWKITSMQVSPIDQTIFRGLQND